MMTYKNETNDTNTVTGVSLLFNGYVFDLAVAVNVPIYKELTYIAFRPSLSYHLSLRPLFCRFLVAT